MGSGTVHALSMRGTAANKAISQPIKWVIALPGSFGLNFIKSPSVCYIINMTHSIKNYIKYIMILSQIKYMSRAKNKTVKNFKMYDIVILCEIIF